MGWQPEGKLGLLSWLAYRAAGNNLDYSDANLNRTLAREHNQYRVSNPSPTVAEPIDRTGSGPTPEVAMNNWLSRHTRDAETANLRDTISGRNRPAVSPWDYIEQGRDPLMSTPLTYTGADSAHPWTPNYYVPASSSGWYSFSLSGADVAAKLKRYRRSLPDALELPGYGPGLRDVFRPWRRMGEDLAAVPATFMGIGKRWRRSLERGKVPALIGPDGGPLLDAEDVVPEPSPLGLPPRGQKAKEIKPPFR